MKPVIIHRNGLWFCIGHGVIGSGNSATAAWDSMYSKIVARGVLKRATYQPKTVAA